MIYNVCSVIYRHILAAEHFIPKPTEGALLFHENNFILQEWAIQTTSGYSSTMPLFIYVYEKIEKEVKQVKVQELVQFMNKIFEKMQLATECIIIALIYLEQVMFEGMIEIRLCNWKPLLFTSILLASKFWEDIK